MELKDLEVVKLRTTGNGVTLQHHHTPYYIIQDSTKDWAAKKIIVQEITETTIFIKNVDIVDDPGTRYLKEHFTQKYTILEKID